jgi:S-formylglutathione hydrolase FrmB
MKSEVINNYHPYEVQTYQIETLKIDSAILKNNPLKDPHIRFNPILIPKTPAPWKVILVLAGFTGNAPFYFNPKFNEKNAIQIIDEASQRGEAPEALYVFVDALTSWGGSQFINSSATGQYEDYIIQELIPTIQNKYSVSKNPQDWCVTGGSSGGYGALHLISKYPQIFSWVAAIAPDCFFEASLLPELYHALPIWEKYGRSPHKALDELRNGKLTKMRNWHTILNAFGMAACYGSTGEPGQFEFPLDPYSGQKISHLWNKWLAHDPLIFIQARSTQLKLTSGIYLDVGNKDNFHLQFGARQLSKILHDQKISHDFVEFDGNHFDIGDRRIEVWRWLASHWRTSSTQ